jgi:hypothetical protein
LNITGKTSPKLIFTGTGNQDRFGFETFSPVIASPKQRVLVPAPFFVCIYFPTDIHRLHWGAQTTQVSGFLACASVISSSKETTLVLRRFSIVISFPNTLNSFTRIRTQDTFHIGLTFLNNLLCFKEQACKVWYKSVYTFSPYKRTYTHNMYTHTYIHSTIFFIYRFVAYCHHSYNTTQYIYPDLQIFTTTNRVNITLINFYQTTRCYNPEDGHLRTHRRGNLKSY